jgi:hypothetical protein
MGRGQVLTDRFKVSIFLPLQAQGRFQKRGGCKGTPFSMSGDIHQTSMDEQYLRWYFNNIKIIILKDQCEYYLPTLV